MPRVTAVRLEDAHLLPVGKGVRWFRGINYDALLQFPSSYYQGIMISVKTVFQQALQFHLPPEDQVDSERVDHLFEAHLKDFPLDDDLPEPEAFLMFVSSYYHILILTYGLTGGLMTYTHDCWTGPCYQEDTCEHPEIPRATIRLYEMDGLFLLMQAFIPHGPIYDGDSPHEIPDLA